MMSFTMKILFCAALISACLFDVLQPSLCTELHDYCLHESMNVSCRSGEMILMTSAQYGRMRAGRCITADYGHMGCSRSVIGLLDQKCSGRSACLVNVRDLVDVRPCRKDFMVYLEAQYKCIEVPVLDAKCPHNGKVQTIEGTSGYLSSVGMTTSPVGSASCPWRIQAGSRQQINFTFIDFGRDKLSERDLKMFNPCTITIVYSELGERHEVNICDKRSREQVLFVSKTNQVELEIRLSASSGKTDFLIQYQVIGCTDPVVNVETWLQREGDNAIIKCNSSEETWFLTCQGTTWIGQVGNCSRSQNISPPTVPEYSILENKDFPSHAMGLAVLIGIVLGVFIGASLLIIVHCFRRKQTTDGRHPDSPSMLPDESNDMMLHSKDMEGSYPALLGNVEGEVQIVKHYFDGSHHRCLEATTAICGKYHQPLHDQTPTTCFKNQNQDYTSGYRDTDSKASVGYKRTEDSPYPPGMRTEDSPYPPGMRTPQPRRTDIDYIPLNITVGCLNHGKSSESVYLPEKLNVACLPDSSFE